MAHLLAGVMTFTYNVTIENNNMYLRLFLGLLLRWYRVYQTCTSRSNLWPLYTWVGTRYTKQTGSTQTHV